MNTQATFDTFMQKVERTTDILETQPQPNNFPPKPDFIKAQEVTKALSKTWDKVQYKADFDTFLNVILAALERREEDYMKLIGTLDKDTINGYAAMYGSLMVFFIDGYYGDPLGSFYMERFSYRNNGEYFTPWNIAYFMAEVLDPELTETVCDPACGSGIMLLAARCVIHKKYGWLASSRYGRNLYGIDISDRMAKMTKINLYLTDYVYMICVMQDVVNEVQGKANIKTGNMLTLNSLFFGIPKGGVRDIAGQIVRETNFDTYIIPCTGRFALADTFASAGLNPEQMLTGDISLFSSVIGYYLSEKNISDLGITIQGEKIIPDITGIAETLYHLKLGSIKPTNYYLEEVLEDLRHGKARHIEKLTTDLEVLKERLTGIRYEMKDMRVMIDEWQDKNVFIFLDPPLYSNRDYVSMFDTDVIKWQEPNISQFDPKTDFAPLLDKLKETKATVVVYLREKNKDDDLIKGWYSFFAHQDTKAEAEYLYSNKDLDLIQAKRANVDNPQRAPYNIISDKDEITENSELSVVNINHEQAMYYRDLFVHRLGVSQAEISLLLLIDEKIFSVRGLMYYRGGGPDYTATEIFGLIAPNKRYRHLGRLAMRAITCTDFRDAITPKNEMFPKRFITSTTLSKYPEAREDKGILEIYDTELLKKTGLYRLRYKTGFKEKTFKDCLIEWLKEESNYGRDQKRKKKRIRHRQRDVN